MMLDGVKPFLRDEDELEVLFFGSPDKEGMRDTVKAIEAGERESIPVPDGLFDAVRNACLLIVHLCPVNRDLIENATELKSISLCRGGVENVDVGAATDHNILVTNNPSHNANAVAEFTVGLMLSETRNISRSDSALKRGVWRKTYPNTSSTIKEMVDMTVGIIGFGAIGQLVAKKLSSFDCRILVYDPLTKATADCCAFVSMEELLRNSDIVSLHARCNSAIIGEKEFEMMKQGSYLINCARSYLVDSEAFRRNMDNGKLLGAAIDVFETEPDIPVFYRKYDNITITNHRGGDTIESFRNAPIFAIKNFMTFLEGGEPKYQVNKITYK